MHELCKQFRFEAAHTLKRRVEAQASRRIHGHSYRAEVALRGQPAAESGMVFDLGAFEGVLSTVRGELDHRFLDDVPGLGPATLENLAAWIWASIAPACANLHRVTIYRDSTGDACSYFGPSA
jgi:6-pyruvoyltetrahydropterin/6-carboxytetrahydropterin synthase